MSTVLPLQFAYTAGVLLAGWVAVNLYCYYTRPTRADLERVARLRREDIAAQRDFDRWERETMGGCVPVPPSRRGL